MAYSTIVVRPVKNGFVVSVQTEGSEFTKTPPKEEHFIGADIDAVVEIIKAA